jgi:hypothetical protein
MFYLPSNFRIPKEPFLAIKVKGVLHPCSYQSSAKQGKYETFIRGEGWKKSKKAIEVPLYAGSSKEEFEAYLNTWGQYCLFYALSGYQLDDNDCCIWQAQQEFRVLMSVGYDYIQSICERVNAINELIEAATKAQLGVTELTNWMDLENGYVQKRDLFRVKVHYSMMCYFLVAPHVDVITDDPKLWKHYVAAYKPTDEQMDTFPESPKERLIFLFGEQVATMYEALMNDFPMFLETNEDKAAA